MADPTLWIYKTTHGEDAVTDRWDDIPLAQRAHAHAFSAAPSIAASAWNNPLPTRLDPWSFGGGVLIGTIIALLFARRKRGVLMVALTASLIVLGAGLYLGFVRREAGLSTDALTSPQAIIGEVHDAAGAMKSHFGEQQHALEQIEASGK